MFDIQGSLRFVDVADLLLPDLVRKQVFLETLQGWNVKNETSLIWAAFIETLSLFHRRGDVPFLLVPRILTLPFSSGSSDIFRADLHEPTSYMCMDSQIILGRCERLLQIKKQGDKAVGKDPCGIILTYLPSVFQEDLIESWRSRDWSFSALKKLFVNLEAKSFLKEKLHSRFTFIAKKIRTHTLVLPDDYGWCYICRAIAQLDVFQNQFLYRSELTAVLPGYMWENDPQSLRDLSLGIDKPPLGCSEYQLKWKKERSPYCLLEDFYARSRYLWLLDQQDFDVKKIASCSKWDRVTCIMCLRLRLYAPNHVAFATFLLKKKKQLPPQLKPARLRNAWRVVFSVHSPQKHIVQQLKMLHE